MHGSVPNSSHEIERKFLLNTHLGLVLKQHPNIKPVLIEQRYLEDCDIWTTRIRKTVALTSTNMLDGDAQHHITLKRKITNISCTELESEITAEFYNQMAQHCGPTLRKLRYKIPIGDVIWEIDTFLNVEICDIVVAEIELSSETAVFDKPWWLGEEVTNERKYKNNKLCKRIKHNSR